MSGVVRWGAHTYQGLNTGAPVDNLVPCHLVSTGQNYRVCFSNRPAAITGRQPLEKAP